MLIESNTSEILLNVLPVNSIGTDKLIFPARVLFAMGCDHHLCICPLEHITVATIRVPRNLTDGILVFYKKITEQQQHA